MLKTIIFLNFRIYHFIALVTLTGEQRNRDLLLKRSTLLPLQSYIIV